MQRRPIKLLYLMDRFYSPQFGTEGQLLQLINALDRQRIDPSLLVFRQSNYLQDYGFPCPVEPVNIAKLFTLDTLLKLLRLSSRIRKSRIALVHILLNDASMVAPFFCKLGGARVVVSRRDMGFWYTPTTLALLRLSNFFVDQAVTNSRAVAENIATYERLSPKKIEIIYNGHDASRFTVPAARDFRTTYGIGSDDPLIGMVASLYPMKRHADLLRAFALVREKHPNAHLALAGDGGEEASLRRLASSLNIQRHVHFLGRVPDAIPIIQCFSVCVLCSASEGLSNAVIEYMGCAKPSVCTNVGGNPELIDDGQNGFLINVGDIKSLADRIVTLLRDPPLAARVGRHARRKIVEHFSLERMVNSYTHLYQHLITTQVAQGNIPTPHGL